ncbi:MAG TPA: amino acid adenylation domain-containing protein, partial [Thermoanaerobaculia bacterium]|nr:amino acid adenylation domain-containing protein [Thermoanaerobaculia bacterium]
TPDDRVLQKTPFGFDVSVWEFFWPLITGACLVVADPGGHRDPAYLAGLIERERVTVTHFVPSMLQAFLDQADLSGCASLRLVVASGEALSPELRRRFRERLSARLENLYGPTEASVDVTAWNCDEEARGGVVPIGRPVANTAIHLLDRSWQPVPIGVAGELCIGGVQLARGYCRRPDLTAERFIPGAAGGRLYRTGDLARHLPDGAIEYLGRIDHQVKIRGFRIELGEIEAALLAQGGVKEAVVVARHDGSSPRLVAYVVLEEEVSTEALREGLSARLPQYMVPAAFVALPAMPLNKNGKVDRKALPEPERESSPAGPRTPVEEVIAALWAELLGLERVGLHESFFDLGGHSLLATRVVSRLRGVFGVELPLRTVLERTSVAELAAAVEEARRGSAAPATPPLVPVPRLGDLPVSFGQQRLWFLAQLEPESPLYNVPGALRLTGSLSCGALAAGFERIVARHESLRTTFHLAGEQLVQRIAAPGPWPLPQVDLGALPEDRRRSEAGRLAAGEARHVFDLARGPLLRTTLLRLAEDEHALLLVLHHAVSDGWSVGVLIRELTALYPALAEGLPSPLPPLSIQYPDFAVWQRSWLAGEVLEGELAFWRERLAGAPTVLELPTDRPRPPVATFRGAERERLLPAELGRAVRTLARREGATPFMVLLTAWGALLARGSGQPEVMVASAIANRNREEIEGLIGFFVNTLALRVRTPESATFAEALAAVRETTLSAYAHQDLPFEKLISALDLPRELSVNPLCQVMLTYQNLPPAAPRLPGLEIAPLSAGAVETGTAKFDLTLFVREAEGGLGTSLEFNADLFDTPTAERLLSRLEVLLAGAASHPEARISDLPLLAATERHQLLVEWNDTAARYPELLGLHELVEVQAACTPDAPALVFGEQRLTYRQLNARAGALARRLHDLGCGPDVAVGVLLERSVEMVVALLGILKAGGAYLAIDPEHPSERIAWMLSESQAPIVLAQDALLSRLPMHEAAILCLEEGWGEDAEELPDPPAGTSAQNLAYILYTSGSTGRPKGVMIPHRGIVNRLLWMQETYGLTPSDRVLQKTPFGFDVSVWEFFWPLITGACLVVADPGGHRDPAYLAGLIERERVTVTHFVPSMLQVFLDHPDLSGGSGLRLVVASGEALSPELRRRFRERLSARLENLYGPTEASVDVTAWNCEEEARGGVVPIGRPVANTAIHLLDRSWQPVPIGVAGELCIGGVQLARGYCQRPDLTAERFIPDAAGGRLYRTGDLARHLPDGAIEYLGRIDHQIKIRGFRVELGEIEAALLTQSAVKEAVVVARQDGSSPRLVAYVVLEEEVSTESLREGLSARLPQYMVPAAFVALPAMPLNRNGKVDRKALPEPEAPSGGSVHAEPRTPVEQVLAGLWAEVLRVPKVGRHDNFFALGGDSILSVQISTRAQKAGVRITPRLLFQHQTVAELAAVANTTAVIQAEQGIVTGPAPLTPIQRWFFAGDPAELHHFNQAVLFETVRRLDPGLLQAALDRLEQHHDALRMRFFPGPDGWRQVAGPPEGAAFAVIDLTELPTRSRAIEAVAAEAQASFDLARGPLGRALWIDCGPREPGRFFWALHHLVVDGVSWRILLEDLAALYDGGELPAKTTSYRQWAERLATLAVEDELPASAVASLPIDHPEGSNVVASESSVSLALDAEETRALLQEVPRAYNTRINDVLLAALASGLCDWTGSPVLLVDLEGHGREEIFPDVDLSRTVGWFTTLYPVVLDLREASGPGACLKAVKEQLRRVPRGGFGHGLLRPEIVFNYLGQLDQALPAGSPFRPARESVGPLHGPRRRRSHLFSFDGSVFNGRLGFTCTFSTSLHRRETVERLVAAVAGRLREIIHHCRTLETRGYTPSDFPLAGLEAGQLDTLVAAQDAIEDIYPLSPMQQGMLFHTLFAPQSYVLELSGRILGDFDREAFLGAWGRLIERHPVLRTSFHWEGLPQPLQVVHRRVEIPLASERQDFHLGQAPLIRLLLVKEGDQEHRLVWTTHLILMDGWSQATVVRELFEIYAALREGREPDLPATPPYRDYIAWLLQQQPGEAEEFWRRELAGLEGPTPLPADRGPGAASEVRQDRLQLSAETTAALKALGRSSRLTLNTLLQGAWALLLARTSGNPEVVFGATVSGRPAELPGIESMVGLFINSLPVRVAVPPQARLLDWLGTLQERQTAARQHEHVPLVDIQGWSPVPRGTPLFESLVVFENYPAEEALSAGGGPGLAVDDVGSHEITHYPLVLVVLPGRQLTLSLFWDRSRFSADQIHRLHVELATICEAMARRPEATLAGIDPLPEWERHQLLVEWNDTAARYPELLGLHELVEVQATCTPDAPALVFGERRLTYRQLNARAGALARRLRDLGCGPDVAVGVLLERSIEMVVALLGILKAGGAYLAIDPEHPSERIAWMLSESRAPIVLTEEALLSRLPVHEAAILCLEEGWGQDAEELPDPPSGTSAQNIAYILYTSGSTGRPKGVMIPHRGIVNRLLWMQEAYGLTPSDRVLQKTPFGFDVSVWEFFWPLLTGACLVVADPGGHRDPAYLTGLIERERVTVTHFVPSMLQVFLDHPDLSGGSGLRLVVASGEALSPELRRRFRERLSARLENLYGPTEASVDVTAWN